MRKLSACVSAALALMLAVNAHAQTTNRVERPLYAGQHILIGKLVVEQFTVGSNKHLRVTYDTRGSNWYITKTHLYVGTSAPKKSAPGQFPYKRSGLQNVQVDTYEIPLSAFGKSVSQLFIAAHADVCEMIVVPDYEATVAQIPATYTVSMVTYNLSTAYMNLDPLLTFPDGQPVDFPTYQGWCVSAYIPLLSNTLMPTAYYPGYLADGNSNPSALSVLGPSAFAFASNPIQLLTYLINQPYVQNVGQPGAPFSVAEVQFAIWHITNAFPIDYWPDLADPNNVAWILTDVIQNGPLYTPRPGDLVAVFADPQTIVTQSDGSFKIKHHQPLLFGVPLAGRLDYGSCETAWARGTVRFSTGWGSYFVYNIK